MNGSKVETHWVGYVTRVALWNHWEPNIVEHVTDVSAILIIIVLIYTIV